MEKLLAKTLSYIGNSVSIYGADVTRIPHFKLTHTSAIMAPTAQNEASSLFI